MWVKYSCRLAVVSHAHQCWMAARSPGTSIKALVCSTKYFGHLSLLTLVNNTIMALPLALGLEVLSCAPNRCIFNKNAGHASLLDHRQTKGQRQPTNLQAVLVFCTFKFILLDCSSDSNRTPSGWNACRPTISCFMSSESSEPALPTDVFEVTIVCMILTPLSSLVCIFAHSPPGYFKMRCCYGSFETDSLVQIRKHMLAKRWS